MPSTDNTLPIPNILTLHSLFSSNPPLRPSLRPLTEPRDLKISIINKDNGNIEIKLGETYVSCKISAIITKPFEDRQFEGIFNINTEITPMCSPLFSNGGGNDFSTSAPAIIPKTVISVEENEDNGNDVIMGGGAMMGLGVDQTSIEIMLSRLIEKAVRRSNALDLESLCIIAGQKCWSIRADIKFLNYDGNLIDAGNLAVIIALLNFKKNDIEIIGNGEGSELVIFDENQREKVGLSVLHIPLSVTFQFFSTESIERNIKGEKGVISRKIKEDSDDEDDVNDRMEVDNDNDEEGEIESESRSSNEIIIVDATSEEELLSQGSMTITLNSNKEVCQISKSGGLNIEQGKILECCTIASKIVDKWTKQIKQVLIDEEIKNRDLKVEKELSVVNDRKTS